MDTEAELTRRGHSSPEQGEEGPRSAFSGRTRVLTWRRAGVLGVVCTVFLLLLSNFVVQPFLIPSSSMEPTLGVGDRVLVNKMAYRFGDQPKRGDVVVFDGTGSFVQEHAGAGDNPVGEALQGAGSALGLAEPSDTDFVKRVVGVGGDDVVCCDADGRIKVNGVPLDEPYLYPGDVPSKAPFRIVVPLGTLWVMGDHRSHSRDSRDHLGSPGGGMVPVEKVIGRADWIGWPVSRWGTVGSGSGSGAGSGSGSGATVGGGHG
ncbi:MULTISPECIES: signal peptidase I [unclassified Streptomyces]|uniref:signal peptidase I n=1 Tax=unclassified Streptomyces TaxID=2593676 RepID=UPI0022594737|nr:MULTISPECIES: signal peptidase I [unclassified Streptomyces]MCX4528376.1 signal peptidase I [Streptomyces sp. NBC_01551]MCX4541025.1 signal peptidase I [Streptomyces sp. NBC_01565]